MAGYHRIDDVTEIIVYLMDIRLADAARTLCLLSFISPPFLDSHLRLHKPMVTLKVHIKARVF